MNDFLAGAASGFITCLLFDRLYHILDKLVAPERQNKYCCDCVYGEKGMLFWMCKHDRDIVSGERAHKDCDYYRNYVCKGKYWKRKNE